MLNDNNLNYFKIFHSKSFFFNDYFPFSYFRQFASLQFDFDSSYRLDMEAGQSVNIIEPIEIPYPKTIEDITITKYSGTKDLLEIDEFIKNFLSEPYNTYTYLYFVEDTPDFVFIVWILVFFLLMSNRPETKREGW